MFTGHRQIHGSYEENREIVDWVKDEIQDAVETLHAEAGVEKFISGMATGTDMWGAEAVLYLRDEFNYPIKLTAAVPFEGQEEPWPDEVQDRYLRLLKRADTRVMVNDGDYEVWKLFERNEWMVDRSDMVIAVYDGRKEGGTYATLREVVDAELPIWRINPDTRESGWI